MSNGRLPIRGRGFTLVELLVVVAIIALLIAMLLPAIGRAQEATRRTVCGTNLRSMGQIASQHAADYSGWFPTTNRTHTNRMGWIMVFDNDSDPYNDKWTDTMWWSGQKHNYKDYWHAWKVCGTPWETFVGYGMTDALAICPSGSRVAWTSLANTGGKPSYRYGVWGGAGGMGDVVGTSYVWISGADYKTNGVAARQWEDMPPALMNTDENLSNRVVAVDSVWTDPVGSFGPDQRCINHRDPTRPNRPAFQNILFGDGHVEKSRPYPDMDLPKNARQAYWADFAATNRHAIYWNPPEE